MPKRTNDGLKKRCDCGRRQWPKCADGWHFNFHHGGRDYRLSLTKVASARHERPPSSKTEANAWRDRLRGEIRNGTFVDPAAPLPDPVPDARLTFGDVVDQYLTGHVRTPTRRPRGRQEMEYQVATLRRAEIPAAHGTTMRLEQKPIDDITTADLEAVRAWRRSQQAACVGSSRPGAKGGECGTNRLLSRIRHLFNWAIAKGHVDTTPWKRGSINAVKLESGVEGARTRRLEPTMTFADGQVRDGEEARLLRHAGPDLRALIVAALSTGCRRGELLSLQWKQIRRDKTGEARWLDLPGAKTKTAEARTIPIWLRLRAELTMRRHGPDGVEHPPEAYVFGNACGERVRSIRTAWELTCERAGIQACARAGNPGLHFHDLRREFASRLLESGADLAVVRMFLGHANTNTTSRYLQSSPVHLERALAQMEAAFEGFAQDSHNGADPTSVETLTPTLETPAKLLN